MTTDVRGPGRIVLLTTTHRVAPGLLSWPAWQELRAADQVLCRDAGHPQLPYLKDAGVTVETRDPRAAELVAACAGGRSVVVLASADGEPRLTEELATLAGSGRATALPSLELLPGSYDLPGARLLDLVQVMDRIRAECPWASSQTSAEIARYGIEEVYELVEAIEAGDTAEIREELGDVLLQVIFHARIAAEDPERPFDIDDVAAGIVAKLVRRHPHVFGDARAETAEDVKALWLAAKAEEKRRDSVTDGVPLSQPGLALAAKLAARARRAVLPPPPEPAGADDYGYRLLALAAEAEAAGTDPETALRAAARTYRDTLRSAERGER
ncbi:nucleoside triphosphate pyrophosphohydrolase [Streptomyces sp. 8K308]|uniref:nucleoside triphosphate pyrophosphohydrolase n=1 Tax=Streptomyces sp. 8K308 TaxID=2530388 RepID=UPI00104D5931|nr:nucleoside triphosphate pyrophosphohydrolase [Streptomyces sp. 8K308]TDC15502.1 nucleoside triphosphate pyrophosphohydrolase [Streptomyces sp. 8K308]